MKRIVRSIIVFILIIGLMGSLCNCSNRNNAINSSESKSSAEFHSTTQTIEETQPTNDTTYSTTTTETSEAKIIIELEEYKLVEENISMSNMNVRYLVITDLVSRYSDDSAAIQDRFNGLLFDFALNYWENIDSDKQYDVTYEIASVYSNGMCVLYVLDEKEGTDYQIHALSLNLNYGLYNHEQHQWNDNFIGYNAWWVWEGSDNIEVLTEGVSSEELSLYLHEEYGDLNNFTELVRNAGNIEYETEYRLLWIYYSTEAEGMVLLIPVSEEMGRYVEIKLVVSE